MAEQVVIQGVKPYDGEYELDLEGEPLTTLEWRWVKKISGYLPLTMHEGFSGGDPDLVCALAVIALRRNGKIAKEQALAVAERLADAPFDGAALQLIFSDAEDDAEGDAGPPEEPPATESPKRSSGGSSSPSSDQPEQSPPPTGTEDSETPTSDPALRQVI